MTRNEPQSTLYDAEREATLFQQSAAAAFTPGMRQLLAADDIWAGGCKLASFFIEEANVAYVLADRYPFTVETLLTRDFNLDVALAALADARGPWGEMAPGGGGGP